MDKVPPTIVVDDRDVVVFSAGEIGRLLELQRRADRLDVYDVSPAWLRPRLKAALRKARVSAASVTRTITVKDRSLRLHIEPFGRINPRGRTYWLIACDERKSRTRENDRTESVNGLREEIRMAEQELRAVMDDLEAHNEKLLEANQELEASSLKQRRASAELASRHRELDAAHRDLENLFDRTAVATLFVDGDLRIKRFTPETEQLLRVRKSDVGRDLSDIAPRFSGTDLVERIRRVKELAMCDEFEVDVPDPHRQYVVRLKPYYTIERRLEGVVVNFVDVSDLKRSQRRAERSEALLQLVIDSIPALVVYFDREGRCRLASSGVEKWFGVPRSMFYGSTVTEVFVNRGVGPNWSDEIREALGGGTVSREAELPHVDGGVRAVEAQFVPHFDRGNAVDGAVLFVQDVTQAKASRNELLRAQEDIERHARVIADESERKSKFLAMLAHELRNPLASVVNALHLLDSADETEHGRLKAIMHRQVQHLKRLVDDLLDVFRISHGKLDLSREPVSLNRIVQEVVDGITHLAQQGDKSLSLSLPEEDALVLGDAERLHQVVWNLVKNSLKYTQASGHIAVSLELAECEALLRVVDDGQGISADLLPRVFELFSQGDQTLALEGGLGIGLTLVRQLVELHGGTVTAQSAGTGQGSEFLVRLPNAPSGSAKKRKRVRASVVPCPDVHRRVLVVEDDSDAAETVEMCLKSLGHAVQVVSDGSAALSAVREFEPEVVLMDIGLPGLDGYEVMKRLETLPERRRMRVVALTGYGGKEHAERALKSGFDAHLVKPVMPARLAEIIAHDTAITHAR